MGQTKETMSIKQRTNRQRAHRMHIHGTQPTGPMQGIVLMHWKHMGMFDYQSDTIKSDFSRHSSFLPSSLTYNYR